MILSEGDFISLGFKRIQAKTLHHIFNHKESKSFEIELSQKLRQPEVSNAISYLLKNKFIEIKEVDHSGKGRPAIIYVLAKNAVEKLYDICKDRVNSLSNETEKMRKILIEVGGFDHNAGFNSK